MEKVFFEHDRLTIYICERCVVHRSVLETCWLNAGSMLSPCDPGCNWPSVGEVLRREELLVLLCRRWVWGLQPRSSCFSSPWQPTSIYKYPSTPLGFELLNLQLDLFLKWFVGWKLQGWMALWGLTFLSAECLSQQETIEREFLQKVFSWKSLIVVRREFWHKPFHWRVQMDLYHWNLPKILESSLKGSKQMRIVQHDWPVPRLSLQQQNNCFRGEVWRRKLWTEYSRWLCRECWKVQHATMSWITMIAEYVMYCYVFMMSHGTETDGENGEGSFKINKVTIIPSSLFPVCHGSDFSYL